MGMDVTAVADDSDSAQASTVVNGAQMAQDMFTLIDAVSQPGGGAMFDPLIRVIEHLYGLDNVADITYDKHNVLTKLLSNTTAHNRADVVHVACSLIKISDCHQNDIRARMFFDDPGAGNALAWAVQSDLPEVVEAISHARVWETVPEPEKTLHGQQLAGRFPMANPRMEVALAPWRKSAMAQSREAAIVEITAGLADGLDVVAYGPMLRRNLKLAPEIAFTPVRTAWGHKLPFTQAIAVAVVLNKLSIARFMRMVEVMSGMPTYTDAEKGAHWLILNATITVNGEGKKAKRARRLTLGSDTKDINENVLMGAMVFAEKLLGMKAIQRKPPGWIKNGIRELLGNSFIAEGERILSPQAKLEFVAKGWGCGALGGPYAVDDGTAKQLEIFAHNGIKGAKAHEGLCLLSGLSQDALDRLDVEEPAYRSIKALGRFLQQADPVIWVPSLLHAAAGEASVTGKLDENAWAIAPDLLAKALSGLTGAARAAFEADCAVVAPKALAGAMANKLTERQPERMLAVTRGRLRG